MTTQGLFSRVAFEYARYPVRLTLPSQYLTSECLMLAVGQETGNLKSLVSERSGGFEDEVALPPPAVAFLGATAAPLLPSSSRSFFFPSEGRSSSSDPSSTSLAGGGGAGLLGFCEARGWSAMGASGSAFFAASLPLARSAAAPPLTGPLTLWAEVRANSASRSRARWCVGAWRPRRAGEGRRWRAWWCFLRRKRGKGREEEDVEWAK